MMTKLSETWLVTLCGLWVQDLFAYEVLCYQYCKGQYCEYYEEMAYGAALGDYCRPGTVVLSGWDRWCLCLLCFYSSGCTVSLVHQQGFPLAYGDLYIIGLVWGWYGDNGVKTTSLSGFESLQIHQVLCFIALSVCLEQRFSKKNLCTFQILGLIFDQQ